MILKTHVYDIAKNKIKQSIVELQGLGLDCEEVLSITENAMYEIRFLYERQLIEQEIENTKEPEPVG